MVQSKTLNSNLAFVLFKTIDSQPRGSIVLEIIIVANAPKTVPDQHNLA